MQNLILTIFSAYVIIQADDREGTFAATKRYGYLRSYGM